jgi:isocitrate dehydrogenase
MVYIAGEEMTRYTMELIIKQWIEPHVDTSHWQYFDLSCTARDKSDDQVLRDAVEAGAEVGSIFKEPTITPSGAQVKEFGLSKALPSPNGAMRRGWNGITISRDTIHIEGVKLGFERPVFFERHAIGGEYGAGWRSVGKGRLVTSFFPEDGSAPVICDDRVLDNKDNVVVSYHNPLDNVEDLAHHFFKRCLAGDIVPMVVTKKTVFKWQEGFWVIMKRVFDDHYKQAYMDAGLIPDGELQHLISDAATMQIIRWTKGGFGMAAHNYDGDMLTDEVAQVHRSPGFITSNLVGKKDDGTPIKEFEASHGTVADLWHMHNRGEETSMNPLGMIEALIGAMLHSCELQHIALGGKDDGALDNMKRFTDALRQALHNTFRYGQGTRDMAGDEGLTTEQFVNKVAWRLGRYVAKYEEEDVTEEMKEAVIKPSRKLRRNYDVDKESLKQLFDAYDTNKNGSINLDELEEMLVAMSVAPMKDPTKRGSASKDKPAKEEQ